MKKLKLKIPLVFFDLETTGTNAIKDRIVQIAAIKINPDGSQEIKKTLVNPEIPIPADASNVHGITDEMVKSAPTFKQIAKAMHNWLLGSDLAGYNSDQFDIPLLVEEFVRVEIEYDLSKVHFVDVIKIERLVKPNTLGAVYQRYTGNKLDGAHDAQADTLATIKVLQHQMEEFDLPIDVETLEEFANEGKERVDIAGKLHKNEKGEICYSFGESKGLSIKSEPGFGRWMLNKDFPSETKKIVSKELGL